MLRGPQIHGCTSCIDKLSGFVSVYYCSIFIPRYEYFRYFLEQLELCQRGVKHLIMWNNFMVVIHTHYVCMCSWPAKCTTIEEIVYVVQKRSLNNLSKTYENINVMCYTAPCAFALFKKKT